MEFEDQYPSSFDFPASDVYLNVRRNFMNTVDINLSELNSWDFFHDLSSKLFGFPKWYGRNMNAWIDLMTYLNDADDITCSYKFDKDNLLVLQISNSSNPTAIQSEILQAIVDCSCFVNFRRIELGEAPFIILSYSK